MDSKQLRCALTALLFIISMGCMTLDRRAPFLMLIAFVVVGTAMLSMYAIYMVHMQHNKRHSDVVVYMDNYRDSKEN